MRAVAVKESDNGQTLTVTFDSTHNPRPSARARTEKKYSQVISTMSFGCLRMVDLDQLYLSFGQRNAIRQLTYTPSVKIGLQFKTAWWEKLDIVGGQSSTDRPIRDVVYPSYGPDESHPNNKKSNCMIASYNGMQDSQRLGGLLKGKDTPKRESCSTLSCATSPLSTKWTSKSSGTNLRTITRGTSIVMSSNLVIIRRIISRRRDSGH
jgi:hypothetical protein